MHIAKVNSTCFQNCTVSSTLTFTELVVLHSGHSAWTSTMSPPLAPLIAISSASTSALNNNLGCLISGTQLLIKVATAI